MALNKRQKLFVNYYLKSWNATDAAKKAGYSEKTAASIGYENLRKPEIKAYIHERTHARDTQIVADADEVMAFLTSVMRGEVKDQFGLDATLADRIKAGQDLMKRYAAGAPLAGADKVEDDELTKSLREEAERLNNAD